MYINHHIHCHMHCFTYLTTMYKMDEINRDEEAQIKSYQLDRSNTPAKIITAKFT